ncbi:PepSY domain-containing protein [Halobacillus shinanisalinarum]|uniref:PepSY domain-containing protein n=1 Tax=Halobacillus shinanisalinarum TaxID=2932258 RepID=A0ABY4H290_9BACI|nr:PepSY domain-containing protein [Halobacillus shinanisalinarum]UOQ94296.1 PepSY domain-containing protein [Halobacillus shinanisalinarum]
MSTKKIMRIVASLGVLVLLIVLIWQVVQSVTAAEPLSKNEAAKQVEDQYNGTIVQVDESKKSFVITIELDTGKYKVVVGKQTGEISNMERLTANHPEQNKQEIKKKVNQKYKGEVISITERSEGEQTFFDVIVRGENGQTTLTLSETGEVTEEQTVPMEEPANDKKEDANTRITKEQAREIAKNQVEGTIEDVEYEEEDGQFFYLVDIERDDDLEATVSINAITGEVIGTGWED